MMHSEGTMLKVLKASPGHFLFSSHNNTIWSLRDVVRRGKGMRNRVRSVDPDFAMFIRSHRDLVSVDRENWEPGSELYAWREHVAGDSMRHRRDFLVQQVAEDRDDGVLAECRAKIERLKTALEVERAAVRRQNKRIEILSADASPETIAALSALPKK